MYDTEKLACEQTIHFLFRSLDGDLGEVEETLVHEHLAYCRRCLRKFRFERRVIDVVREKLRSVRAPDSLKTRIAHLLEES